MIFDIFFQINCIMNIFNILRFVNDSDDEENDSTFNGEKFTRKEVDFLYKYFIVEGLKQSKCIPQNWKINKEHIYASLRRNNGDVNKARKELYQLIKNENFDIRTFYKKFFHIQTIKEEIYIKPYLSGQKWQINPKKGMYLLNNDKVYKISYVSLEYNIFTLHRIITRYYNIKTVRFTDEDVCFGKYIQINEENLQKYLEKEFKFIRDELEREAINREIWLSKQFKRRNEYIISINEIQYYHDNNCTLDAKLKLVGKFNLPINVIKKIVSFNIESICTCQWSIIDLRYTLNHIDYIIDEDYLPYNKLKYEEETAFSVLSGFL